ncbi:MAG: MarR family winged helix-turn-helix transcriptional regulator [Bacteroidota bacterium]
MSLEKDIKQKEFHSFYHKAILNILYTQNYLVTIMADVFKDYDITRQQYNVLRILRGQYPGHASINLIKDRMIDKMSDTSRIVERLRLKGLIAREDGKSDKRSVEVTITHNGLDLLEKMQDRVDQFEDALNNLSLDEVIELNRLLDKIRSKEPAEVEDVIQSEELLKSS